MRLLRNAVVPLLLINILVFIIQQLFKGFTQTFVLVSSDVLARPWILVTSMFLHADLMHLLFNMYALLMFGSLVERRIGTRRFLVGYFAAGLFASIVSVFFYNAVLGASGAIMGILGITIILMPDLPVLFLFFIPMSLRIAGIIFAAIDIFGIFVPSGIANIAHLAGLAIGLGYGYFLLMQLRKSGYTKRKPASTKRARTAPKTIELSKDDVDNYFKYKRI
ncbi:MAG: rhomboid family intramembrane serine protease [archaeon]